MHNSLEDFDNRCEQAEERIRGLKDRSVEVMQFEEQKEKAMDKNEQSFSDVWDPVKLMCVCIYTHTYSVIKHTHTEGKEKGKGTENIFEENNG